MSLHEPMVNGKPAELQELLGSMPSGVRLWRGPMQLTKRERRAAWWHWLRWLLRLENP